MSILKLEALHFRPEPAPQSVSLSYSHSTHWPTSTVHGANLSTTSAFLSSPLASPRPEAHVRPNVAAAPHATLTPAPSTLTLAQTQPHLYSIEPKAFDQWRTQPLPNIDFNSSFSSPPQQIRVKKNDSLSKLSREYGVPASHIAAANQLDPKNLNFLREGASLTLPDAHAVAQPGFDQQVKRYEAALKVADAQYWNAKKAKQTAAASAQTETAPRPREDQVDTKTKGDIEAQIPAIFKKPETLQPPLIPNEIATLFPSSASPKDQQAGPTLQSQAKLLEQRKLAETVDAAWKQRELESFATSRRLKPTDRAALTHTAPSVPPIVASLIEAGQSIRQTLEPKNIKNTIVESLAQSKRFVKKEGAIAKELPQIAYNKVIDPLLDTLGAAVDLARFGPAAPTERMLRDVKRTENFTSGLEAVFTDFPGVVTQALDHISNTNKQIDALNAAGRTAEASRLNAELRFDIGSHFAGGAGFLYGTGRVVHLAASKLPRAPGAPVPSLENVFQPHVQPTVLKVNDAVVKAVGGAIPQSVKSSASQAGHWFANALNIKITKPAAAPVTKSITAADKAAAAAVAAAAEAHPGLIRTLGKGTAATGIATALGAVSTGEPIKVYVNTKHPNVYHNASPTSKNITFQVGGLSTSLWGEVADWRMYYLLAQALGIDRYSLPYARAQNGYSGADAPRFVTFALGGGINSGTNDYATRLQGEFRLGTVTFPTQGLLENPFNNKNKNVWGGLTGQLSIAPVYINIQPSVAMNEASIAIRNISTFMTARTGITPAKGRFIEPVNSNTPVSFATLTLNPGAGRRAELEVPASYEIYLQNLFNDQPVITKPSRELPVERRNDVRVLSRSNKLMNIATYETALYTDNGALKVLNKQDFTKYQAGESLEKLGRPAILVNKQPSNGTRINDKNVFVIKDNGSVGKLSSREAILPDKEGNLWAVPEDKISSWNSGSIAPEKLGQRIIVSKTPLPPLDTP